MKVTFESSKPIAKNIKSFYFRPEKPMQQIAGQFTELKIPHASHDDRGEKRWFTLSNSPKDELLSITTKLAPENGSSFKLALQNLKPGTKLNMASPMGDFVLPKDSSIPLLFVAGGIGTTPFHSIIKYLQDTGQTRNITLLYAANNEEEIAFKDIFSKLGNKFIKLVGQRLTGDKILKIADDNPRLHIYISGPEPMVEALNKELKEKGIKHLHGDFFPNYTKI